MPFIARDVHVAWKSNRISLLNSNLCGLGEDSGAWPETLLNLPYGSSSCQQSMHDMHLHPEPQGDAGEPWWKPSWDVCQLYCER
jgi:hypothetical protein